MRVNQQVSEHLNSSEVRCRCGLRPGGPFCDGGVLRAEAAELFERIRARCSSLLGQDCPLAINSGVRCDEHNRLVGGASDSRHLDGKALDIRCPKDIPLEEFWRICEEAAGEGGCGRYAWGAHVDVGRTDPPRRWKGP